ncbi:MAG: L-aspartate oxidase [Rhizobiales bacterium]|nr:L-aspartate oxidase [Hyphomicrobiales bacterium]
MRGARAEPDVTKAPPILIVGGGIAGLFCALKLAPRPVRVLAAAPIGQGASSAWAQGGIAAAISEGDTAEKHTADTVAAGAGTVDEGVVLAMAREARARIDDLLTYGVPFDKDLEGHLVQSREAAHSERRIVRVKGDAAGAAIMLALAAAVRASPHIEVMQGEAESLIAREGRVEGVIARDAVGRAFALPAAATVLATGGVGFLYAVTTNPPQARGAGVAMAARAGATIADAEFVQFHPTAIDIGRDPAPLATEALRGDGCTLINKAGERFMAKLHKDAELAPRDIVARGVFAEIAAGRGAFLDCRTAVGAEFAARFPTVYASCMSAGIDPATTPIPVAPAEHYHMGGVWTDERGKSSLDGLHAAGEVSSTGVHGANRLASNSLLEAVVFASRIADDLRGATLKAPRAAAESDLPPLARGEADAALVARLRKTMNEKVGVVRDEAGLGQALEALVAIDRAARLPATRNMAATALMIAAAAWSRRESRGGHYRADYPTTDPRLAHRSAITLEDARAIANA